MKKVLYLARKLKAFGFNDIFILAETPKAQLNDFLKKLTDQGLLKKDSQGYVYTGGNNKPEPPVIKPAKTTRFIEKEDYTKFNKPKNSINHLELSMEELEAIPSYNKRDYLKYKTLLKVTRGLFGKQLQDFIEEYNKRNPENPTSYPTLLRKRQKYAKFGEMALICNYGKNRHSNYPKSEIYPIFKDLYFSPKKLSIEECRLEIAKYLNLPTEKTPSSMTYRRWLHDEMSKQEIKERRLICF